MKTKNAVVVATQNTGKINEIQALFHTYNLSYDVYSLQDIEMIDEIQEDGTTFEENAQKKIDALRAYMDQKYPVILREYDTVLLLSDDSGLCVEALLGAPGLYSKRYAGEYATDEENNDKLLKKLEGISQREAYFEAVLIAEYYKRHGVRIEDASQFHQTCFGRQYGFIAEKKSGTQGFGYDPIFCSEENKTNAEQSVEEKNRRSHRGKALHKICTYIQSTDMKNKK